MNGGDIIAKILQKHGVKYLFTLCGGHISPIFVAADKIGIRVVDTRHEATAVFAADAVSRLTGSPGIVTVTAGPGVTNAVTALKNASLAQSPLVLLGGAAATILKGRGSLQDIDQMSIMKSVCKWSVRITRVRDIVPLLEEALCRSQEGVPGPVFVECPIDILYDEPLVRSWYGAKSKDGKAQSLKEKFLNWYVNRHVEQLFSGKEFIDFNRPIKAPGYIRHTSTDVSKTIRMLETAQKPLLIIGSGAMMQPNKVNQMVEAIESMGIPVYLSGMARGLLGKNHPLHMRHKRKEAIKDADFIFLAGVPNDFRMDYGSHIGKRSFCSVNRSKEDLFRNKKPTISVWSDPMDFLIEIAQKYKRNHSEWIRHLAQRDEMRESEINEKSKTQDGLGLNPLSLFKKLDQHLSDDAILIADGGDFVATASYTLRARKPLSWLDPGVYGTLGVGAGFALGAKLVYPDKDVWIIYGDCSAGYSLVEYDTFHRLGLPIISLIGNDACWGQIARDQLDLLGSECALILEHSEYQKIANAFSGDGQRVETMEAFEQSIANAQKSITQNVPYIINAILSKSDFRKGSISV